MNAIRSSGTEREEESCIPDKNNYFINGKLEKKTIEPTHVNKGKGDEDERITISISRKAYYALEAFTKEFNQGQPSDKKPLTIEEALDEEILLLFSDEWNKK